MRLMLVAGLLVAAMLAGCSTTPARPSEPIQDVGIPEGIVLEGSRVAAQNQTAVTLAWVGRVDGELRLSMRLPGTLPFSAVAQLQGSGLGAVISDEYGKVRCRGSDTDPCVIPEIAALGWDRTWSLLLSSDSALDASLDLAVSLASGAPVASMNPAGLDRIEAVEAVAEDGAVLRGHVYIPRGAGPFATLLEFTPYSDSGVGDASDGQAIDLGDRRTIKWASHGPLGIMLDAGFAVAIVTLRGTGDSSGCQTWFDVDRDGKDAAAVIESLAAMPWSNGNVGMVGISWHGYSQYAALAHAPSALKAVAPSSAILDHWTLWSRNGAVLNLVGTPASTPASGTGFHALFTLDNGGYLGPAQNVGAPGYVEQFQEPPQTEHLACPEYVEQNQAWTQFGFTGDDSPYFQARAAHDGLRNSNVPVLATNGLLPWPQEGHITQVDGLWPLLPAGSVLMVGQWSHQFPSDRTADRYDRMLIDWFDEHLRGGSNTIRPGVYYQDSSLEWHSSDNWPPTSAPVELTLSRGALTQQPADGSSSMFLSREGSIPTADDCPSQATYVSPPLKERVLLAGNFHINLTLSATAPDGNLGAYLWAVDADFDFECEPIDGRYGTQLAHAVTDLRHRGNLRVGEPFPMGGNAVVSMDSQAFAAWVEAGQRLVLAVGGDAGNEVVDKPVWPVITVHNDGTSTITLPTADGQLIV